jgi:hypothetical protein
MIFNELPISFPWYDKIEQQNRYNENVEPVCDYKLISPRNSLLPFQFTLPATGNAPTKWEVYDINSQALVANLTGQISALQIQQRRGKDYIYFEGQTLPSLDLPQGFYYSQMLFPGNILKFSEMFFVPADGFNAEGDDPIDFMRIVWYNLSDLPPIFYNDLVSGVPRFKNIVYLDTFITASEPEITKEGVKDGTDEVVPTFQKMVIKYRITVVVPDFLKKALSLAQIHDYLYIETKRSVRSGQVLNAEISSEPEANGGLSIVDIVFTEDVAIVKKGCADNMV